MSFGRAWPLFATAGAAACGVAPAAIGPPPEMSATPLAASSTVAPASSDDPPAKVGLPVGPRARRLAENVARAFSNVDPRPVTREMAQQPWVLFQTDRTVGSPLGPFAWREAPVRVLHGPSLVSTKVEPCAKPVLPGEPGQARGGSYHLERGAVFDRLSVDNDKIAVKLPPGSFHGGCVVDEKRLWLAWSTPARPADLLTITLKDGTVRPLRDEARPGLGGLADLEATEERGLLVARRATPEGRPARGVIVLIDAGGTPPPVGATPSPGAAASLGAFSPLVRAFVEAGYVVVRRREGTESEANASALLGDLVNRRLAPADAPWIARLTVAPRDAPPRTLFIDPADRERTLAQALTLLTPEPVSAAPSAGPAP